MGRKKHFQSIGLKEKKVKNDGTTFEDVKNNVEKAKKKTKEVSPGQMMMNNRGGRSFGQFNEMLQKAKEGKNVIYASMLGNFEIRYIKPQVQFDDIRKNLRDAGVKFDPLCRGIDFPKFEEHTKPLFVLDDLEKMTDQMQNFGYKPGEGKKRELTHFESFQELAKVRSKFTTEFTSEFLLHKFAFFDFVVGIAVGTACTVLSFLFG